MSSPVWQNTAELAQDAGATSIAAPAAAHTAGRALLCCAVWHSPSGETLNTVTNTAGDTWVRVASSKATNGSDFMECFVANNIAGHASDVVSANFTTATNSTFRRIMVYEFTGVDTSQAVEAAIAAIDDLSSPFTHSALSCAREVIICTFFCSTGGPTSIVAGTTGTVRSPIFGGDTGGDSWEVGPGSNAPDIGWGGTNPANDWSVAVALRAPPSVAPGFSPDYSQFPKPRLRSGA